MATTEALSLYLSSLDGKSYYDILGLAGDAPPDAVKAAFHAFSLLYHPDCYVEDRGGPSGARAIAAEIYKRGVEAYRCLSRPEARERYDRGLARGKIRFEPWLPSTRPPPPPPARTLEEIARTPRARQFARRAERLIAIGRLADARVELVSACQHDPDNAELSERLTFLYEALALEPT